MSHSPRSTRRILPRLLTVLTLAVAWAPLASLAPAAHAAPPQLTLTPSLPSGVAAGTPITWTATSTDPNPLAYQFSVAFGHNAPTVVRDFSLQNSLPWTPQLEGSYTITVAAKEIVATAVVSPTYDYGNNPTAQMSDAYTVTTTVTTQASVSATTNPLVALYRAPSCAAGDDTVVQYRALSTTAWTLTNEQPCVPPLSRPFYVAGMLPNTTYQVRHLLLSEPGNIVVMTATTQTFQTGSLPSSLYIPAITVPISPTAQSAITADIVDYEYSAGGTAGSVTPEVTNLKGQVLWYAYQADLSGGWSVRDVNGEHYLFGGSYAAPLTGDPNVLREIDLAGNLLRETNIGAINDQLARLGYRPTYGFNHDALPLPNGDLAVIGFSGNYAANPPVLGESLIVLDQNLRVVWVWDSFAQLPYRPPTLTSDTCSTHEMVGYSCPLPGGPPTTIDWLHMNSIDLTTADNNIMLSLRDQDWVIKIDYDNGLGDGHVIWRLGPDGDFTLYPVASPSDPFPWFSHQHDVSFLDSTTLAVFDNGNTRCYGTPQGTCDSRGQEYLLDETAMSATLTLNVDLGSYSAAVGSAQRLANGNFNFDSGRQKTANGTTFGQTIEVLRSGAKVYVSQFPGQLYRAWRLTSMYSTINPPCPTCSPGY